MTRATANAISPNAMSTSGFTVCWTDLVTSEPFSVKTMMRPTVTLIRKAPARYPAISLDGLSSSSIMVVAASSVGFNDAVSARRAT